MKLNKFLLSAIAAASLTACSDSTDVVKNDKGQWNADGTGYVSLSIKMPDNVTSNGTRAAGAADGSHNDQFNDGDLNEYAVYNAMLVIFTADQDDATEGNYKLAAAYKLPLTFNGKDPAHDQISSISTATAKIDAINAKKAKALVILNKPNSITLDEDAHTIKLNNGGTEEDLKDKTFADFQKETTAVDVKLNATTGFTMTNAPLTTSQSGTPAPAAGTTTTLADINIDNVKRTAEEAKAAPAADVYVERSVAKVTINGAGSSKLLTGATDIHYQVEGFALDNTNSTSYIVRNADQTNAESNPWYTLKSQSSSVNGNDQYRFIGNTAVKAGYYRTYWAKDPNYDVQYDPTTHTEIPQLQTSNTPTFAATSDALYCMENTFTVQNQIAKYTTRALLKVCFWKGAETTKPSTTEDLYMYNNDVKTLNKKDGFTNAGILEVNKIPAVEGYKGGVSGLEFTDKDSEGNVQIKKVTFVNGESEEVTTDEVTHPNTPIFKIIREHFGNISVYEKGYAYYPVLIKHFGDQLTPWNTWETDPNKPSAGGIDQIYPNGDSNRDANYLGRYGVVRNNWYELKINSVKRPGKPAINTPKDTPDDELESYISVSINILSWAKRSQDVDLQ